MRVNPNLVKEDKRLSSVMSEWQEKYSSSKSIVTHLKDNGFYGFSIRNLNVPFTPVTMQAIEEKKIFTNDEKTKFGSCVKMVDEDMLEIFVAFI